MKPSEFIEEQAQAALVEHGLPAARASVEKKLGRPLTDGAWEFYLASDAGEMLKNTILQGARTGAIMAYLDAQAGPVAGA